MELRLYPVPLGKSKRELQAEMWEVNRESWLPKEETNNWTQVLYIFQRIILTPDSQRNTWRVVSEFYTGSYVGTHTFYMHLYKYI